MKILVVSDEPSKSLWDYYTPDKLKGIDLMISCGDLSPHYLQFLVTMGTCPLIYVRGNHDAVYEKTPPEGCVCIEDRIFNFRGLRIMGLGGSMRYKPGPDMYTEKEMAGRIRKMRLKLGFTGGIDLLVTHAPASGYGDMEDLPHKGFACFNDLMDRVHPICMLHGHVHKTYGAGFVREREHPSGTRIINAYESYILDIPEHMYHPYGETHAPVYDRYCKIITKLHREESTIV